LTVEDLLTFGSSTNGATNRVGVAGLAGAIIIEEYS
jgi:hypothetical protein